MTLKTAKEIWDFLKQEYEGNKRVKGMQVLNLILEFEMQKMKELETIQEYYDRLFKIFNKVRLIGTDFSDSRVALKQRRLMRQEGSLEGVFQAKSQNNKGGKNKKKQNKDNKLGGSASSNKNSQSSNTQVFPPCPYYKKINHPQNKCWWRPDAKCHKCGQLRHVERICTTQQQQREAKAIEDQPHEEQLFVVSCFATNSSTENWLINSGCTNYMTYDPELFRELDATTISKVRIGNRAHIAIKGKRTVAIEGHTGLKLIYNVLYVLKINQNLLSVTQLLEKGYKVLFEDKNCMIKDAKDREVFKVQMKGKSFSLDLMKEEQASVHREDSNTLIWHKRLGHFHHITLLYMKKNNLVKDLPELKDESSRCVACQYGKQTRILFQQNKAWRAIQRLQLIHTDVGGPMKTPSLNNSKYYIVFIDDYSRMCWIYFMKLKSKVADILVKFKAWFYEDASIEHQLTAPYTPQQNGVVERKNKKIIEMARCLLHDKGLPKKFWSEAVNTAVFLLNKLPIKMLQKKLHLKHDNWSWENDKKLKVNKENDDTDDENVRGTRSLSDIYQRSANDQKWIATMKDKLKMIEKNQTWELVDRPEHKKAIGVKWVYRTKLNPDGSVNKHKASLIFKGYAQMFGVDFFETFAPIARLDTIRMLLALAAQQGWELIDRFKEEMKDVFQMTNLGRMTFFLGMQAAKRILRYVKGTIGYGIRFNQVKNFNLHGYSNSDWAGCVDDMRSTSGYYFSFGSEIVSGIVSWCSKKQEVIAQSTIEAEYVAVAAAAVNQALWIRKLMTDLHMEQQVGTQIFVDN
ncbi:hypothetical protein KPL70_007382 [Citrus sinensis]|nr:hypothetical protein KPL70_007382 [Citrus sinensis]